ncbi:MAG: histidinol-phosphate transaminase [Halothiobacillaceae bacterium]|nr:histidinol-phosphate transaminase [Halothiobacillaceae bacterium]
MSAPNNSQSNPWLARACTQVCGLAPYVPGKPLDELERELGIQGAIKLASNENPLGPSPRALATMRNHAASAHLYPDGNGFKLKQALAQALGVAIESITLGNGSNDVLDLIARAFLGGSQAAVFSEYAFAVYPISTQAVGALAQVAQALPADHAHQPYGHDLAAMRAAITEQTRVVFLANPNNPTGTWVEKDALYAFIASVPADVLVVVDEAYIEFVDDAADFPNALAWLAEFPNLVVTRTFSKIHGLAGLRVGYAVSNPQVAEVLNRVRQPFNVSLLAMEAAVAALNDTEHVERTRALNSAGLAQVRAGLADLGLSALPSMGNFLCIDMRRPAHAVYDGLLRLGVITRPVAGYGMPQHLRVSIGTEVENARFLSALKMVMGGLA